jgi:ketosteroid isomerase-like protein
MGTVRKAAVRYPIVHHTKRQLSETRPKKKKEIESGTADAEKFTASATAVVWFGRQFECSTSEVVIVAAE